MPPIGRWPAGEARTPSILFDSAVRPQEAEERPAPTLDRRDRFTSDDIRNVNRGSHGLLLLLFSQLKLRGLVRLLCRQARIVKKVETCSRMD
jgi:hypothetical protein